MSTTEVLTPYLIESIQRGEALLFLGAGASIGAISSSSKKAPRGDELRDLIADRFLGGRLKDKSLAQVSEYAKSEGGLPDVQQFISECFNPLQPADFHLLIPTFRWYAIVTTNFDLVVERAYNNCPNRQQTLEPIIQDGDRFSQVLRDPNKVPYLKLHGCISHVSDPNLPLILASEEYAKHRKNRERLFRHFADWARERTVIFCGYDLADPNLQQIIFDLSDLGISRPMYGLVNPGLDPIVQRYWEGKRFAVYPSTFEAFLHDLDASISESARALSSLLKSTQSSIDALNKTHMPPSSNLLRYLQDELEHIHKGMATVGVSPTDFYKGIHSEWGVFQQDLDVRRRVADELIIEAFLDTRERAAGPELYLLKGHAGSGKSITLKRVAWDIANEYDGVVFFLKEGGVLRREHLLELHTLIGQRLYIVIEDAIPHISDIQNVFGWSEKTSTPITLILGARNNEWNVYAGSLESSAKEYELSDLTEREIGQLIQRLEKCNGLGRLSNASPLERLEHFKLTSERQLLVALHDLAGDKPFEEIILDEYLNIEPPEARIIYLDVCTLHRLGVGIRAGLVSRISGITFDDFGRNFFRPLEHVVHTFFDYNTRDNMYRTRHREIAEMVFTQAMRDPSERAAQIVRIMRSMDVDYSSDEAAFRQMIRGRALADDFSDKKLAMQIFEAALESGAPAFVVEHQRAVFELRHGDGDPTAALSSIEKAERSQQHVDKAIQNTKAAILRELATRSPQKLLRSRYREAAKKIIERDIVSSRVPHPFSTLGHIFIDELKDKLDELSDDQDQSVSDLQERSIADTIRSAEQTILQGLQRFPDDEFLLDLEAGLARILADEKRALSALRKAFEANPGRGYIAVRYSTAIQRQGDTTGAKDILKRSLAANPSSKEAHFAYAQLLIHEDEMGQRDDINYHLRRSFTQGDSNLDAQFWTARHNFLYVDRELARTMFQRLEKTWIPAKYRNEVKGKVREQNGSVKWFNGSVKHVAEHYCYVASPDLRDDVFAYEGDFDGNDWNKLSIGRRVSFILGFNFRGPRAIAVRVQS